MEIPMWRQSASFLGAMLILVAYAAHQMSWRNPRRAGYHILNAIGSAIPGYIVFRAFQVGFVVLELAWTRIRIHALFRPPAGERTISIHQRLVHVRSLSAGVSHVLPTGAWR